MARYERARDLIRLVLELQASTVGLSLDDIKELFEVSRRTAERMLHAVKGLETSCPGRPGCDRIR